MFSQNILNGALVCLVSYSPFFLLSFITADIARISSTEKCLIKTPGIPPVKMTVLMESSLSRSSIIGIVSAIISDVRKPFGGLLKVIMPIPLSFSLVTKDIKTSSNFVNLRLTLFNFLSKLN